MPRSRIPTSFTLNTIHFVVVVSSICSSLPRPQCMSSFLASTYATRAICGVGVFPFRRSGMDRFLLTFKRWRRLEVLLRLLLLWLLQLLLRRGSLLRLWRRWLMWRIKRQVICRVCRVRLCDNMGWWRIMVMLLR